MPRKNPRKRRIRVTLTYEEWQVVTRAFYLADQHKYAGAEWIMECADRKEVYDKIIEALLPYVPRKGGTE